MKSATTDLPAAQWLRQTIHGMVDDQEAVSVTSRQTVASTILTVKVAAQDVGKVIGKSGRNARSLRAILAAIGAKQGMRLELDVEE